ncbi:hypothetical protein Pelo_17019 [Pelomyxa schiedti]|nr:hypothetical protein Pelo_17019 [Pelomyxa schiedti]
MQQWQRAREQLLALVMASHNRCGAASPARHFASMAPLATAPLWDWCRRDTEVVFKVGAWRGCAYHHYSFGISASLMSVTRDVSDCDSEPSHKWQLRYGAGDETMTVIDLVNVDGVPVDMRVLNSDYGCSTNGSLGISFNRQFPDEVLFVVLPNDSDTSQYLLIVIDVSKSFTTSRVAVLSVTKVPGFMYETLLLYRTLFMNRANGDRIFICPRDNGDVYEFAEGSGTGTLIARQPGCLYLSQLGTFLFCISKRDCTIEIWDCSRRTTQQLRVLTARNNCPTAVIGHAGFLFQRQLDWSKKSLDVTDSTDSFYVTS